MQVRRLYREKLDEGLSSATVQKMHVVLHKALGQAVRDGLFPRNVTPKVVSEMLGHASIAITLDIYSHVLTDMQGGEARALKDTLR